MSQTQTDAWTFGDPIPIVLLSIHPEHAQAILNDEKGWEYRRERPVRGPPLKCLLYATDPVQQVVGQFGCTEIITDDPHGIVDRTARFDPHIDAQDVLEYFDGRDEGHAMQVTWSERFEHPIPRDMLEYYGIAPSQNFRYVDDRDLVEKLTGGSQV